MHLAWKKNFQFPSWRDLHCHVSYSLVKNTVIRKALLDFIQALFASSTCFDGLTLSCLTWLVVTNAHLHPNFSWNWCKSRSKSLCVLYWRLLSVFRNEKPTYEVACVAWRFKQFEREHTKRWGWRSLSRLSRFPIALKLLKNRQATQATHEEVVSSPQPTSLQLLALVSGFPFLLTMIFLWMSLVVQLE